MKKGLIIALLGITFCGHSALQAMASAEKTQAPAPIFTISWYIPDHEGIYKHGSKGSVSFTKIEDATWDAIIDNIRKTLRLSATTNIRLTCEYRIDPRFVQTFNRTTDDPRSKEDFENTRKYCQDFEVQILSSKPKPIKPTAAAHVISTKPVNVATLTSTIETLQDLALKLDETDPDAAATLRTNIETLRGLLK